MSEDQMKPPAVPVEGANAPVRVIKPDQLVALGQKLDKTFTTYASDRRLAEQKWMRNLLRVVRASERGNASSRAVADHLAKLNNDVAIADESVGPRCIVAWRSRKNGIHKGGGEH